MPPSSPVPPGERQVALDALRGWALLGVLLVNLDSDFRMPLSARLLPNPILATAPVDRVAEGLIAGLLEFKAFTVFSLLFGVGLAVFAERAPTGCLARRLLALLGVGLVHLLLVWNGDILTLYAVCGLLLLPLVRLPPVALVAVGIVAFFLPRFVAWGLPFPSEATLRALADEASRTYGHASPAAIVALHLRETREMILALLVGVLPRTLGLMALGAAVGRWRVFQSPDAHRGPLAAVATLGLIVGGVLTLRGDANGSALLGLGYAAGFLLLPERGRCVAPVAAVGRMALSNYLAQSVVLSVLFYAGGLFGKVGAAAGASIGIALYAVQLAVSDVWLRRFRFGPVEWLWRSLTYGRWQEFARRPPQS